MFEFDRNVLIASLTSILRILRTREPNLRQFCNLRFIRRLSQVPEEQVVRKCVFILGHCTLHNIALLHRRGVFREKILLQIIRELLTLRKVNDVRIVRDLMDEFTHFEG